MDIESKRRRIVEMLAPAAEREALQSPVPEPIAIVGLSGYFPNNRSVRGFWNALDEDRSLIQEVPAGRFDVVFSNDALFYVHPRQLVAEIRRIRSLVRSGGRLLILDVPVKGRTRFLKGSPIHRLLWRLTGVFQPGIGGFFVDETLLLKAFPGAQVRDSWSAYRAHIEIPG